MHCTFAAILRKVGQNEKQIYLHVGLGKVASTYLQYSVFPKFKGIEYIQRTRYNQYKKLINASKADRILLSREFDNQLYDRVKEFSGDFPGTRSIILLRRHDSWIASQYRRFLKNGYALSFDEFIDIKNDSGFWKLESLAFYKKIRTLEQCFTHKPLVLFYDDMRANPGKFIQRIADYVGADFNPDDISLSRVHTSYNEKQLKVMRRFGRYIDITNLDKFSNPVLRSVYKMGIYAIRYPVLYGATLVPDSMVNDEPLIPPERLQAVAKMFEEDWQQCRDYAQMNPNPA